ncbi:MAG: phosphoglycerate transporter, partial [Chloroflexota bacterium]|nr:phosphoglycerate transporter [Chloroflexota bacterium]
VTYCSFSIRGEPFDRYWDEVAGRTVAQIQAEEGETNRLFREIRRHGLAREFPLIIATMGAFAKGTVKMESGKLVDAGGSPLAPYDLTDEIEARL